MRRLKRILKWTGIVLLVLAEGLTLVVMMRQNLKYTAPYPDIQASTDRTIILRGKQLVFGAANCAGCHSKGNVDSLLSLGKDVTLDGGLLFQTPIGKIYSKNITPDNETGIGKYTDAEIARILRYGVRPDGTAVFDFMPFHNTSDEDMTAIISYLRSQTPVKNEVAENSYNILGYIARAFMIRPVGPRGEVPKSIARDTSATYGKYLALNVADCNGCHTKRNMTGEFTGKPFAGGNEIEGFITPDLTNDTKSRIANWSQQNFIDRFRVGRMIAKSPMPWNSFKRMNDTELKAIYNYLRTVNAN